MNMRRSIVAAAMIPVAMFSQPATSEESRETGNSVEIAFGGMNERVADLPRAIRFYSEVFGLKVARTFPDGPIEDAQQVLMTFDGTFDVRSSTFISLKIAADGTLPPQDARAAHGQIVLVVTDTGAVADRAEAAGYSVRRADRNIAVVTGPDGYLVELLQKQ